jgi:hypothetical protein
LSQPDDPLPAADPSLVFVKSGLPKKEEDWVKLIQKQEMLHQLELEKWHDLLGTATQLLRQVRSEGWPEAGSKSKPPFRNSPKMARLCRM